jgi:epoxide hydrolase-like predicted phosphatase
MNPTMPKHGEWLSSRHSTVNSVHPDTISNRYYRRLIMPIRAVIFDFGDVLARIEDPSGQRKWEQRLGLPQGELPKVIFESEVADRSMIGQATEADVWQYVAAICDLSEEQLAELQRDFWSGWQLDTVLVEFLRDLRPRYKTAILSNAWPGTRRLLTDTLKLNQSVDEMIISAEEGVAKPDQRIYQIAIECLEVQPEEAIFVDDLAENVQAARAYGMQSIQFRSTRQAIAEVKNILMGGDKSLYYFRGQASNTTH